MNRREFIVNNAVLALLAGIAFDSCAPGAAEVVLPVKKFTGNFDRKKLIFLLRRSTLGFSPGQLDALSLASPQAVLDLLMAELPKLSLPLNFEFAEDRLVPIGQTWINAPYRTDVFYEQYRKKSLRAWLSATAHENPCSLRHQLTLFWLNFYAVSDVIEHKYEHRHITYLHQHAWGNFKQITSDIAIDPAMLRFLSGFENTRENPNENFARELLELFTVGRGEIAGAGDYTTFTEKDVAAVSKILIGWKDDGWFTSKADKKIGVEFVTDRHDTGSKQLSPRFDNKVLTNKGATEYKELIDLIFEKKETAVHFTRRLYRWFCCDEISAAAEQEMILPLAQLLRESNYEVKPVVMALLQSEHFYSLAGSSARIKNPMQYTFDLLNFYPLALPQDTPRYYSFWADIFDSMTKMGMELMKPPSVAGWKAYYQGPGYSRLWINAASLQSKKNLVNKLTHKDDSWQKLNVKINYAAVVAQSKATSFSGLVAHFDEFFFRDLLSTEMKQHAIALLGPVPAGKTEQDVLNDMRSGREEPLKNVMAMTNYLFNLPMLNIC